MGKEQFRGFNPKKRNILMGAVLSAGISMGMSGDSMPVAGIANQYSVHEPEITGQKPLDISYIHDPKEALKIASPSPKEKNHKNELESIIAKMEKHPTLFKDKYIQDVKMYYPIYKAVADKYDMDWFLIWIVHENETGASAGVRGFSSDSYYVGAMQRDPNIWGQSFVQKASRGLEELANLPQRHKNDWKEIATGAAILDRNIDHYVKQGEDKTEAVKKALFLYSADGPAERRFEQYKKYENILTV